MLLLAAAALSASTHSAPPLSPFRVEVQARATVRIVAGVRLRLDSASNEGAPRAHETMLREGGLARPAQLIEFE